MKTLRLIPILFLCATVWPQAFGPIFGPNIPNNATSFVLTNILNGTNAAGILENLSAPSYVSTFADLAACGTDGPSVVEILGRNSAGDGGGGAFLRVAAATYSTNNGTVINGVGCQLARMDWLLNTNQVRAIWFGTVGDGATDDSTAIRNAQLAADTVLLSRGTFYLGGASTGFRLTNPRLKLIGENPYDTILTNAGTDTIIELATNGVFEFRNLQFKGAGRGIQNTLPSTVASSGSVLVDNCRFITNYYYPLEITGSATAWYTNDVKCDVIVRNSYFEGFSPPGIYPAFNLYDICYDSVLVENCGFFRIRVGQIGSYDTGIDGLWAGLKQKRATISGCTIDEDYGSWELTSGVINIWGGLATVQNCDIKRISNEPVYITPTIYHNGPRLHVLNNVFDDFGSVGIYTKSSGWAPSGTAADYQGAFANIIAGNVFRCSASTNQYYGVIHASGFEYLVEDNTLEECYASYGIYTKTGLKNSRIINNHIYGGLIDYPIWIEDGVANGYCEKVDIEGNTIEGIRRISGASSSSSAGAIVFSEKSNNLTWRLMNASRNKLVDLTDWRYGIVATSDNTEAVEISVCDNYFLNAGDLYGIGIGPTGPRYRWVDISRNTFSHTNASCSLMLVSMNSTNRNIANNIILTGTPTVNPTLRIGTVTNVFSSTSGSLMTRTNGTAWLKTYGTDENGWTSIRNGWMTISTNAVASLDWDAQIFGANTNTMETGTWAKTGNGWDDTTTGIYAYSTNAANVATITATLDTTTLRTGRRFSVVCTATGAATIPATGSLVLSVGGTQFGVWTNGQTTLTVTGVRTAGSAATVTLTATTTSTDTLTVNLTSMSLLPWAAGDVLAEINVPIATLDTYANNGYLHFVTWGTNANAVPIGWYFHSDDASVPRVITTFTPTGPWHADVAITRGGADTKAGLMGTVWDANGPHPIGSIISAAESAHDWDVDQAYICFTGGSTSAAADTTLYGYTAEIRK